MVGRELCGMIFSQYIGGSSNGRTAAFEAVYLGSIPSPPANLNTLRNFWNRGARFARCMGIRQGGQRIFSEWQKARERAGGGSSRLSGENLFLLQDFLLKRQFRLG